MHRCSHHLPNCNHVLFLILPILHLLSDPISFLHGCLLSFLHNSLRNNPSFPILLPTIRLRIILLTTLDFLLEVP